jgi:hypothetical protein
MISKSSPWNCTMSISYGNSLCITMTLLIDYLLRKPRPHRCDYCINGLDNVLLGFRLRRPGAAFPEGTSGQDGARPHAHVLGRAVLARELVQVVIDIGGVNRLALAGGIDVLKKLIPWQLLAPFHNGGEATVVETHRVILPAFAAKVKF